MIERRPGIAQLVGAAIENAVPFLRNHKMSVEQAQRSLDSAYSELGGETGRNVTEGQIHAVLYGELRVLESAWFPKPSPSYANAGYFHEALKFHTDKGLLSASTFMFVKADFWREVAFNKKETNPNLEAYLEAEKRASACARASRLLTQKRVRSM